MIRFAFWKDHSVGQGEKGRTERNRSSNQAAIAGTGGDQGLENLVVTKSDTSVGRGDSIHSCERGKKEKRGLVHE